MTSWKLFLTAADHTYLPIPAHLILFRDSMGSETSANHSMGP